jgi:mannosidase alpha-like ER degradation enhancer 2
MKKSGWKTIIPIMAAALSALTALPARAEPAPNVTREEVREEFLHAWNGYKKYAWGHDELKSGSAGYSDWYKEPLLMTPVDALDTMYIMGLDQEAEEARELIASRLSFDRDIEVKHFEIVIRLLGGLLSAYELSGDQRLLDLARDLADRMAPVFDSPTGMPYRNVNLRTGKTSGRLTGPAEIATSLLEYGTLSRLTGNPVYYDRAKKAVTALYQRSSKIGLPGFVIDVDTGAWIVRDSGIGSGIDSYFEYLLKSWVLFGDEDCKRMWEQSVSAINAHLADEAGGELWYGHANMKSGRRTATTFGALDAYFPAVLALSGDLDRAGRLEDSCLKMWNLSGIEPEIMDYRSMRVVVGSYPLRPEIVESAYYLYHFTGEQKYRDMGQVFFSDIKKYCRTEAGYASLADVRTKTKLDIMPSYFLAETLKYFYLLFAPPGEFDFSRAVFNTEAHPLFKDFKAPGKKE